MVKVTWDWQDSGDNTKVIIYSDEKIICLMFWF